MEVLKDEYEGSVKKKLELENDHKKMSDQKEKMEVYSLG